MLNPTLNSFCGSLVRNRNYIKNIDLSKGPVIREDNVGEGDVSVGGLS